MRLPGLWSPSVFSFLAIAIAVFGTSVVVGIALIARAPAFLFWSVLPCGLGLLLHGVMRIAIPPGVVTVKDLVKASIPGAGRSQVDHFAAVLFRVRELTSEQLGFPLSKVLPESRFVEDLEID